MPDPTAETLEKNLGLLDVYSLATGATLSAGFFLLPGLAAEQAGPALVLAYLLAVVPLVPAMLSMVELMTAMPRAGGIYFFLDRSLGPMAGTVGGLGTWLVLILKVAFALVGMGAYISLFLPEFHIVPVAVGLALAAGAVNLVGAKITGRTQVLLLAALLALLALFIGGGLPRMEPTRFRGILDAGGGALLSTAGLVYVSYVGLTKIAGVSEEVSNPERNLPLGVFLAIGTAVVVYGLGTAVIVGVVPMETLRGDLTSVATAGEAVFGRWGAVALSVAALTAFAAVTNAGTMTASRYPLAMSRDGILPGGLSRLSDAGMPARSILLTVGVMVLVIVAVDPTEIAKLASAFQLLVFGLVCLAVIVMRESRIEEYDPGYLTPGYPWLQLLGIVAPAVLIAGMGWWTTLFSLGLVAAAGGWYAHYVRESAEREGAIYHIFERLGRQRYDGLERELRQILMEKGLREADPYAELVGRAGVVELAGERTFREVLEHASEELARKLPATADHFRQTFLEETQLGITPVSHGAAIPHVRLQGIDSPYLLLVRARDGLRVEEGAHPGSDGSGASAEEQVHALFILVSPEDDPRQHLRMLAHLAEHAQEEGFLEEWLAAEDEHELKEILLREDRFFSVRLREADATSELIGRSLDEAPLPDRVMATVVRRGDDVVTADGDLVLRSGDRLTVLGSPECIAELRSRYPAG